MNSKVTTTPALTPDVPARPANGSDAFQRLILAPALLYFLFYCLLFYPVMKQFSTRFFCDQGDGMQNVFNIWWVNKAVTQLHQSPWQTSYLHFPEGTSLLGQTLNPFNGFVAVALLKFLTLAQTYNFLVVFSFVAGGLTAFWLCYDVTRSYAGSLVGGFIFTFSSYHCAHALAHMQLVSLEWLPLVALAWRRFLIRPTFALALGCAAALLADILCDYYYFLYAVLVACLMVAWQAWQRRDVLFIVRRPFWIPLGTFLLAAAATSGALAVALLRLNHADPLLGSHSAWTFSADLLSPFVPGQAWRFSRLTAPLWARWTAGGVEDSVFLGLSVIGLAAYAWAQRRRLAVRQDVTFFIILAVLFTLLSFGPGLHIAGHVYPHPLGLRMPYLLAVRAVPALALSGMPVRMMVITYLAVAVLASAGLGLLLRGPRASRALAGAALALLLVEYLPWRQITSPTQAPGYVQFLKAQPAGAVLDVMALDAAAPTISGSEYYNSLYYLTLYNKPLVFGYISRTPTSVDRKDRALLAVLQGHDYARLYRNYHVRYLVVGPAPEGVADPPLPPAYRDAGARVYDLAQLPAQTITRRSP